ncbi:hypothetical protein NLG97_g5650 [Lecanicillium saksenae]|uniref:Uncharacterized protein n=1 Tax=Lecanicillium saksenae TaxID=468837 RepID=A0ACC1QT72_9HYPO|nr:hypothetical protein NLG97_g5650 [Lecanicillium saksenae]
MLLKIFSFSIIAQCAMAKVQLAGFDFGCGNTNGDYSASAVTPPLRKLGGVDGVGQMNHFVSDDGLNVFRLPVCWQYLVNGHLGGSLDTGNVGKYDQLVQACLNTGAYCVIDVHNYARWGGKVIGQSSGTVTNGHFASLWRQLAAKYAGSPRVIFGVMNEPHDLDINQWATSVQYAVTAIRQAAGTDHMVLLPGTMFTAVGPFISDGSAAALSTVKNPDGSVTRLIFDVHQYLDGAGGTQSNCVTNGIDNLDRLGAWLRRNKRQAILTETGGGSTASCYTDVCAQLAWMNKNSDVYLGWIGWAAGAFPTSYALAETPTYLEGTWHDTGIKY